MQRLLSIALSCLFAVTLSAQEPSITYPYNPDSNTDSLIGASDLVDFLPFYGEEFTPEPLTIEGMSVEEWMEQQTSSSGGGCDYRFPQGLEGETITHDFANGSYTVPESKNLYITYLYRSSNGAVMINSIDVFHLSNNGNSTYGAVNDINLYLTENDVIFSAGNGGSAFHGVLIDKNSVQPICQSIFESQYIVPVGKKLIIKSLYNRTTSNDILLNGIEIGQGDINHNGNVEEDVISNTTLILESGDVIEGVGGYNCSFNGYLVDEDYFADCGGGGGVDISGLQEQIDAVAADSYAADEILQAQIFNLQEQLDSALAGNEDSELVNNTLYSGQISYENSATFNIVSDTIQIPYIEGRDLFISSNNMMQFYGGSSKLKIIDDEGMDISAKVIGTQDVACTNCPAGYVISSINDIQATGQNNTITAIIRPFDVNTSNLYLYFELVNNGNGSGTGTITYQY